MSEAEIVYTSSDVYSRLGVSGDTLRKYSDVLEREGYDVRKIVEEEGNIQILMLYLLNS